MTIFNHLSHSLSRCFLIALSCISLNAYSDDAANMLNGVGGTGISALNGVGGTGIHTCMSCSTATGRITAFGSVYVNGIHYNTDNAQVFVNHKIAELDDLYLGNIIQVKGTVNKDKKTGIAELVTYSDTITGPVTLKASNKTIEVMNQSVVTDDLTVLHGFKSLSDLDKDYIVEVSGFSAAHGKIKASSIRLISNNYTNGGRLKLDGFISNINKKSQTFRINNLTINYSKSRFTGIKSDNLTSGLYLTITTHQNIKNNRLTASNISLKTQLPPDIELYGNEVILRTTLQSIDVSRQAIEILGQTAYANTSTLLSDDRLIDNSPALSLKDFDAGDFVLVIIRKDSDGQLTLLRLSKIEAMKDTFIAGLPESIDEELGTLTLFNQIIYTDKTEYLGIAKDSLLSSTFFSSVSGLQREVQVTGQVKPNGAIDATRLELSDSN